MAIKYIIVLFVEIPRKFITAKLSIRKPGSSSVLMMMIFIIFFFSFDLHQCLDLHHILLALMKIRAYGSKALQ
jgi:hypothetical protein